MMKWTLKGSQKGNVLVLLNRPPSCEAARHLLGFHKILRTLQDACKPPSSHICVVKSAMFWPKKGMGRRKYRFMLQRVSPRMWQWACKANQCVCDHDRHASAASMCLRCRRLLLRRQIVVNPS